MKELISGKNSVLDAIKNKLPIKVVYTTKPNLIKSFKNIKTVSNSFLDKLVQTNHQGFVAELNEFNYFSLDVLFQDKPDKVLILDHIQDPRNLGAILRSANAFGVCHIIIPKDRAAKVTTSALKVSSGGFAGLKVIRVNSLIDAITKMKKNNFWIYSTTLDEDSTNIDQTNFNYPLGIIVGNEEKGVSNTLIKHSDAKVYIPMKGTVQSLNVSVAAAIALYKI